MDFDELADVVCSYAAFCRAMLIPSKRVKIYHDDKRWVNKSVKSAIGEWKLAFECGGRYRLTSSSPTA